MTIKTFSDGDVLNASDLNNNFSGSKISQIYTGTDLDYSGTATTNKSVELTAITSTNLYNADYVSLDFNYYGAVIVGFNSSVGGDTGEVKITIQSKEIGGTYSDTLAQTTLFYGKGGNGDYNTGHEGMYNFTHVHTLTSGEKTNGVQFKIVLDYTYTSNTTTTPHRVSFTNKQTILKLGY